MLRRDRANGGEVWFGGAYLHDSVGPGVSAKWIDLENGICGKRRGSRSVGGGPLVWKWYERSEVGCKCHLHGHGGKVWNVHGFYIISLGESNYARAAMCVECKSRQVPSTKAGTVRADGDLEGHWKHPAPEKEQKRKKDYANFVRLHALRGGSLTSKLARASPKRLTGPA
eukprot:1161630-Pelagomonas_calceolata.AAC.3